MMDNKALIATAVKLNDNCGDYESVILWKRRSAADNNLYWFLIMRYHYYETEYDIVTKVTPEQAEMLEKTGLARRLFPDQEWEIIDESNESCKSQ